MFEGPPSWSPDASVTRESTKCPWVGVVAVAGGEGARKTYLSFLGGCLSKLNQTEQANIRSPSLSLLQTFNKKLFLILKLLKRLSIYFSTTELLAFWHALPWLWDIQHVLVCSYWAEKLLTDLNLLPLVPDEEKKLCFMVQWILVTCKQIKSTSAFNICLILKSWSASTALVST